MMSNTESLDSHYAHTKSLQALCPRGDDKACQKKKQKLSLKQE